MLTGNFDKEKVEAVLAEKVAEEEPKESFSIESELSRIQEDNLKNEFEALKLEHETLLKEHKKIKKDYNKLNASYTKLKEEDSQLSFGSMNVNSEVVDELLNLDILNMNLIDCVNTLYNLQKKAKENR